MDAITAADGARPTSGGACKHSLRKKLGTGRICRFFVLSYLVVLPHLPEVVGEGGIFRIRVVANLPRVALYRY